MTVRQKIVELLSREELTALELSQLGRLPEKEIIKHLLHVAKSVAPARKLTVLPSHCETCGFIFKKRNRFTTPSRCPLCRSERISSPVFTVK